MDKKKREEAAENILKCLQGLSYADAVWTLDVVGEQLPKATVVITDGAKQISHDTH